MGWLCMRVSFAKKKTAAKYLQFDFVIVTEWKCHLAIIQNDASKCVTLQMSSWSYLTWSFLIIFPASYMMNNAGKNPIINTCHHEKLARIECYYLYVCAYFKSVLSRWNKTNTRLHSFGPTIECIHVYMCWLDNIEHRLHEKIWSRDLNCRLLFKLTTFVRLISRGISLHYQLTRIIFISHSTVWKYVNSIYWSVVFFLFKTFTYISNQSINNDT